MPEITIDIEVWCSECGQGICHLASDHGRNKPGIDVGLCDKCLKAARDEARNEGYDEGYQKGYEVGKEEVTV